MKLDDLKVYALVLDTGNDSDDGSEIYRVHVPAFSEEEAIDYVSGNGEVIVVRDMGKGFIDVDKVVKALVASGFGTTECNVISRILTRSSIGY